MTWWSLLCFTSISSTMAHPDCHLVTTPCFSTHPPHSCNTHRSLPPQFLSPWWHKNPRLDSKVPLQGTGWISQRIEIFHPNLEPQGQPFINGCFNWMIPNLCIGNGCFTKHLFLNGCLGFQEKWRVFSRFETLVFATNSFYPVPWGHLIGLQLHH